MKSLNNAAPLIMGILNITPDSFSDGGLFNDIDAAINHGKKMIDEGADIIDIGGESTRPYSKRVSEVEQLERVIFVIKKLKENISERVKISIDTRRASVAEAALEAGASIINDVSGGTDDPDMIELCAEKKCPYVIMHMQGEPDTMQISPQYDDVVKDIACFLNKQLKECIRRGLSEDQLIIDPGIGFGKTSWHNLLILKHMKSFVDLGFPVLLGTSRKRFMGTICHANSPDDLVGATTATTALGVEAGVKIFRVHDVKPNRQAANIAWEIMKS